MANKILLVDDDAVFRSEFKDCFSEHEIIEASCGEEALKILKKPNVVDLVILDVSMPGLSGTEVLRQIKAMSPDLGIIILTGHSSEDIAIEALRAHADNYIEKPLDVDKTRQIIEDALLAAQNKKHHLSSGSPANKMDMVKDFIERNCYKKIGLEDAALEASLSPKYLSRAFKQVTGVGFGEYKLKIKIREARSLLKNTPYNINEISQKLQYENTESFIRIFKKLTGRTPTEYRKNNRRK